MASAEFLLTLNIRTTDMTSRRRSSPSDASDNRIFRASFCRRIASKPDKQRIGSTGFAKDVNNLSVEVIRNR